MVNLETNGFSGISEVYTVIVIQEQHVQVLYIVAGFRSNSCHQEDIVRDSYQA